MAMNRRQFNTRLAAASTVLSAPFLVRCKSRPKVVVIGGGAGGATAARYLAKDSQGALDVTLIENSETYTTCFFSNLYLGDLRTLESLTHNYSTLETTFGIKVVKGYATEVDRAAKVVKLQDGSVVAYDRVVVAPGIDLDYESVPGYSKAAAEIAPHAWKAGAQTALLKGKLDAMEDGQDIVMVAPPNPYRCPPGPYERASMMAHFLKTRGFKNSRITILDVKSSFAKQGLFAADWEEHYPGVIEWLPPEIHGGIINVDASAGVVKTDFDDFEGTVLNIIPAMRAGAIASRSGLTDSLGYCPIDGASMRSVMDENVFVIGDASMAGAMPKSGFSANSQAKVAAHHIRADLLESSVYPVRYANTCWSLISPENSVKVGALYTPNAQGELVAAGSFVSDAEETAAQRKASFDASVGWYDAITTDMFG